MIPMLPMCGSPLMPLNPGLFGMPATPMMPMLPMAGAPLLCPPNLNLLSTTTSSTNEWDSRLYGRFRHVERESSRYRHAPFDWYRPPKSYHDIIHEDAAVVTNDGPVPIGDFYRYYIYGDYDDDDDDDDGSSGDSLESDDIDDDGRETSFTSRNRANQRYSLDEGEGDSESYSTRRPGIYSSLNTNRQGTNSAPNRNTNQSRLQGNRTLAGDDDFDDAASVNSTYR